MSKSFELPVEENEKPIFFVLPRFERDQLHHRDIEKFSLSCMGYFQRDPAIVYRGNRAIPIGSKFQHVMLPRKPRELPWRRDNDIKSNNFGKHQLLPTISHRMNYNNQCLIKEVMKEECTPDFNTNYNESKGE